MDFSNCRWVSRFFPLSVGVPLFSAFFAVFAALCTMDILSYTQQMFEMATEGKAQGVWFWGSIYTLELCLYSSYFQIKTRFWKKTKGQLVKLGIEKFGNSSEPSEQSYAGQALYSYSINGKTYKGSRISPWIFTTNQNAKAILTAQISKIETHPNNDVLVHYNPKKPQKSYLIIASKVGILITLLIAFTPLFLYLYEYHA